MSCPEKQAEVRDVGAAVGEKDPIWQKNWKTREINTIGRKTNNTLNAT